ncbi:MAG TPA: type II secretion system protein GspM [Burkholderiales bacterium]|nr:type II secretion system protein GspM [Burkholderiales bacterium]
MDRESLKHRWRSATARERTFLAAGAIAFAVAALYALLWEPGIVAIRSLSRQLPRLEAQIEEMHALRGEIAALRDGLKPDRAPRSAALLQATLEADPLVRATIRMQWRGESRVSLEAAAIEFDRWIGLVSRLQRELGVRMEQCTIAALPQPGMVKMEAVLALPAHGESGGQ